MRSLVMPGARASAGGALIGALALLASAGCSGHSRTSPGPTTSAPRATAISWPRARRLLHDCQAKRVEQTHSRLVVLTLRGGGMVFAREPKIDDVVRDFRRLHGRCGAIVFATE